jgi:predicted RNA binding protein YcfA (HicA-like mRNA interferase family)
MARVETNQRNITRRLLADGWQLARHGAEHDIYTHPNKKGVIQLPRHRTISPGVARSVAKLAGWQ